MSTSGSPIATGIHDLNNIFGNALNRVAQWNALVPSLQAARQQLSWMEVSISQAPNLVHHVVDEELQQSVWLSQQGLSGLLAIPEPPKNIVPVINTAGSANPQIYQQFVNRVSVQFQHNAQVAQWLHETNVAGEALRIQQDRSGEVRRRLRMMSSKLEELHQEASRATLVSAADVSGPIEAATTQRTLLDQFKGHLINLCKTGSGVKYSRIADNLAAHSELTRNAVQNGQIIHDALHHELTEVLKKKTGSSGERMQHTLKEIEDHIWVVISALDPDKAGFSIVGPA